MSDIKHTENTRVLIVGDSLSLPRASVRYEFTWPSLLKSQLSNCDVIVVSRRGMTTDSINSVGGGDGPGFPPGSDFLEFYQPSHVILQLGIVDCYPRHFKNGGFEKRIISRFPAKLRAYYISLVKKLRGAKPELSYVPIERFRWNLICYIERAIAIGVQSISLISISPVTRQKAEKTENIDRQIDLYNRSLLNLAAEYDFVKFIEPLSKVNVETEDFTDDGYHISENGHYKIYQCLLDELGESDS